MPRTRENPLRSRKQDRIWHLTQCSRNTNSKDKPLPHSVHSETRRRQTRMRRHMFLDNIQCTWPQEQCQKCEVCLQTVGSRNEQEPQTKRDTRYGGTRTARRKPLRYNQMSISKGSTWNLCMSELHKDTRETRYSRNSPRSRSLQKCYAT